MKEEVTAPVAAPKRRWIRFSATPDGRVTSRGYVPDFMLAANSIQPQSRGYYLAGSPESEAQRAAVEVELAGGN